VRHSRHSRAGHVERVKQLLKMWDDMKEVERGA